MNRGQCVECGSAAINHHCHGRDGSNGHLCDVCYWRKRADSAEAQLKEADEMVQEMRAIIDKQGW